VTPIIAQVRELQNPIPPAAGAFEAVANQTSNIERPTPNLSMHIQPDSLPTGHDGIMARLQKGPTIHSSAWVVPTATVLGDVIIEEESSVWYGAVLRGDINRIIIGPRSNVQDNAVVHVDTNYPTTVGELVTIGHTAVVHACTIDNEVLVGMGAIVLDDVEVGARSIIGANALITMGMKIPPGSLVLGSPAKIRRQLTLDEQNDIARWASSYVETTKHYREFY
jgi:carbonic anhydrase/acetyltransferase-like protein (isoleucine patch superfamily)